VPRRPRRPASATASSSQPRTHRPTGSLHKHLLSPFDPLCRRLPRGVAPPPRWRRCRAGLRINDEGHAILCPPAAVVQHGRATWATWRAVFERAWRWGAMMSTSGRPSRSIAECRPERFPRWRWWPRQSSVWPKRPVTGDQLPLRRAMIVLPLAVLCD
jgi:hypothetical protein